MTKTSASEEWGRKRFFPEKLKMTVELFLSKELKNILAVKGDEIQRKGRGFQEQDQERGP